MHDGNGDSPISAAVHRQTGQPEIGDALLTAATLLFVDGQTTERTKAAIERLSAALGMQSTLFLRWDEITIIADDHQEIHRFTAAVEPTGVDMGRVTSTNELIDDFVQRKLDFTAFLNGLHKIRSRPSVGFFRFILLAGAGAAALGVIFGVNDMLPLLLIACSAAIGAAIRRGLARFSRNPFIQPLTASLFAGLFGAATIHLGISTFGRLIAFCPCMVLVPGPHLLSGAIDLVRTRITLGISRLVFAGLIILSICVGLLGGLAFGDVSLPAAGPAAPVLLWRDVVAAGVAVAAYGTFFAMPWRTLPIPIMIGMFAHALRWLLIFRFHADVASGAFGACFLVGIVVASLSDRLRLPFAALAFASVVSLIPGVFLFQAADSLLALIAEGGRASPDLMMQMISDGGTAFLILLAMTLGLLLPKMAIDKAFAK
jgi:uncharacterized membrane protein YjjP (DUF1212 family)